MIKLFVIFVIQDNFFDPYLALTLGYIIDIVRVARSLESGFVGIHSEKPSRGYNSSYHGVPVGLRRAYPC